MKLLVTGGTGFVGLNLIPRLDFCEKVLCVVRKTSKVPILRQKNVEFQSAGLDDKKALEKAMKGVDVVVHMAALIFSKNIEEQRKVNVEGTRNIIEACKKAKVKKLVYVSSVAVLYGKDRSNYGYSLTKKEAEGIVMEAEFNSIILRPSLIYGKGSRLMRIISIARCFPIIPLPKFMLEKRLEQPVFIGDVVDAIIASIKTNKLIKNHPYFIACPGTMSVSQIIDKTTIWPFKPLKLNIPAHIVRFFARIYQKMVKGSPIQDEHFEKQLKVYEFDISDARKDFGFNPKKITDVIKR